MGLNKSRSKKLQLSIWAVLIIGLALSFVTVLAYQPVLFPEWSFPISSLHSELKDVVLYDMDNDRLSEVGIALTPNQIMVLANTGDSILWRYQTLSPVAKLAVLPPVGKTGPLLLVAAPPYLLALNSQGKIAWQILLKRVTNQAVLWLETGNVDANLGNEIVLVAEDLLFIVLPKPLSIIRKVKLPFLPKQIAIGNLDKDVYDEIVLSDFVRLIAYKGDGRLLTDFSLANENNNEINQGFDLYDFNFDRIEEIVAITKSVIDTTKDEIRSCVTCFQANGKPVWQNLTVTASHRNLKVMRGEIFVGGTDYNGQDYLLKIDRNGRIIASVNLRKSETPTLVYSPAAQTNPSPINLQNLSIVGNFLLVGLGWQDGNELAITKLRLFSPTLEEINLPSPEYFSNLKIVFADQKQKLVCLAIGSINGDTLADLLVARKKRKGEYAIDYLLNRTDFLARDERELWNDFRQALKTNQLKEVSRLRRRAQILAANSGNTIYAARTERLIRQEWHNYLKGILLRAFFFAFLIIAVLGSVGIFVIRPLIRKRTWRLAQLEAKSVPNIVKIATDLVALNHNYIVKGNWQGAFKRLNEIIEKYGLNDDRDLSLLRTTNTNIISESSTEIQFEPTNLQIPYRRFIKRLTKEPRTINLVALVKKICDNLLGGKTTIYEFSLNRNEYRPEAIVGKTSPAPDKLSVSFLYLINRDFPEIYNVSRLFWDARLYNWLEHICTDHLRYAKSFAHFVFDYESATEWNRKIVLHLVNDSIQRIDFNQRASHLLAEFEELKSDYSEYIQIPTSEQVLYYPGEKIWIKFFDLISILGSSILF